LKKTVFLGVSSAKIAEFSNKVPFDVTKGWFLPFDAAILSHNKAYFNELEKAKKKEEILESKCTECIYDLNVEYAVINTEKFPELPEKPVLEQGRFKLYKVK